MDTRAALLAEIIANPDDDGPRLILADLLDERGDPRGAFIRVQVELADWREQLKRFVDDHGDRRLAYLRRRERELLLAHWIGWAAGLGAGYCLNLYDGNPLVPPNRAVEFRRGFVEFVECSFAFWRDHGDALRLAAPLRQVRLATVPEVEEIGDEWYKLPGRERTWSFADVARGDRELPHRELTRRLLEVEWAGLAFELSTVPTVTVRVPEGHI
jgi:uncharacterized protein (TIGR02996 family)